jgi:hypothetical protein
MTYDMQDSIRELVEAAESYSIAATIGPWIKDKSGSFIAIRSSANGEQITGWGGVKSSPDVAFIVHARQWVPALCAEVRRLDAEVERLHSELKRERSYGPSDFIDL